MWRRIFVIVIAGVVLLSLSCSSGKKRGYPVLGEDGLKDIGVLEDHSEALLRWMKKGIRNAILINVDTHDDIRWIPDEKLQELAVLYSKKQWEAIDRADENGDERLYNIGNFIYAAARLGIVRELYWIIPYGKFSTPDPLDGVKRLLRTYSFPEESIRAFALIDGCVRGSFYGIPVSVCGIEHLPEIREPIVLSIDVDFYPPVPVDYQVDRLGSIKLLMDALFDQRYRVMDAVVAYSVRGGYLIPYHRWMGDATVEILKRPSLLEKMPDRWRILSAADYYLKTKQYIALKEFLEGVLKRYPESEPVKAYLGFVYLGLGYHKRAFDVGKQLCDSDIKYCYLMVNMGIALLKKARLKEAEPFFRYAYKRNPRIDYGHVEFGNALRVAGRYEEAISYYLKYRKMNGSYPVDFIIGQTYLMMGNEKKAREFFDSGKLALRSKRYVDVKNDVVSEALKTAVKFYEEKNLKEYADEIRKDRRLADLL